MLGFGDEWSREWFEQGVTSVDIRRSVFFGPMWVVSGDVPVEGDQGQICRIDSAHRPLCALLVALVA